MLARAARPAFTALAAASLPAVRTAGFHSSGAQLATLRELEQRVKSVRNIEKITKSMKMIAATKLNKAQRAMAAAKAYGEANNEVFKNSEAVAPEGGRELFIVVSSDKGLCGGIHSSVSKRAKIEFAKVSPSAGDAHSSDGPSIVVLGDKPKAQLGRAMPNNLALSFNQIGKDVPTFSDAAAIADLIFKSGLEFDKISIIYNAYISAIAFESHIMEAYSEQALRNAPSFAAYEQEEDTTKDLAEFSLANAIFAALVEGHASEINSRRNAMDNASKNAGEMIQKLSMEYNRGRQAAITNELVDIVTGASAV
ncbi:ATP synthase F1 gamma [Tilletiaria anomala UBC 951]|uniref:ATP synthase subunit gamma n=1 Tax=Tilletiaria anomala (strain ATCC 24038 / CBS 436.72 / UBC 951) TaxID=1037660 RepID=A0A066WDR8_TILAU|nr:ATP synthase F1 gamma [Tilletiaria anomala UBC 951]KDN49244.1 ATP synthase F1 gamma [Tilletiaria anomala UBC 951]